MYLLWYSLFHCSYATREIGNRYHHSCEYAHGCLCVYTVDAYCIRMHTSSQAAEVDSHILYPCSSGFRFQHFVCFSFYVRTCLGFAINAPLFGMLFVALSSGQSVSNCPIPEMMQSIQLRTAFSLLRIVLRTFENAPSSAE